MMAASPHYSEGEVIANKYVVEGLIGESPAARTFLANGNAGKLAIKFYRPEFSSRLLAAPDFFLKAGVMTEIEHDNLAACVDVQEEMGLVFVARAYCEGQSFEDWARKHRSEGNYFTRGLELLWQVTQGLAAMHERTRHLDIHPGNVIVGPLMARLCDWDPRALGNMEMTPDALPVRPEFQGYRAAEAGGRNGFLSYPSTDLFAVAGLLYRLVKGDHPTINAAQTLGEIRAFDKELAGFLGKAMHPKPEERFQDAGSFSDALWELQAAMGRLQERNMRTAPPQPAPRREPEPILRKAEPLFPDPPPIPLAPTEFASPAVKEPVPSTAPKPAGNDTFFNFFPPTEEVASLQTPAPAKNKFQPPDARPQSDTLFGAPSFQSPREPAPSARDSHDFGSFSGHPGPQGNSGYTVPPQSGLGDLEAPGTLFGAGLEPRPRFANPAPTPRPQPRSEPPVSAKPSAVSLSALEKDPLEMAASGEPAGFTAYGFQGAGDNRTGIYTPEARAAAAKTKLMILLGTVGVLILVLGLTGLFLYLRGNAARKDVASMDAASEAAGGSEGSVGSAGANAGASGDNPAVATGAATPPPQTTQPTGGAPPYQNIDQEEAADPGPVPVTGRPQPAVALPAAGAPSGYSEPPMPVEPLHPGPDADTRKAAVAHPSKAPAYPGNSHVTPEREAELMTMVQSHDWPNSAAACIQAGDDLNDLKKTAEANLAYSKALLASDAIDRQRILAYGGLAVTFQAMGMRDQARDAVERILAINPKNAFALKLKARLQ
jgi:Protein kinase domain